METYNSFTLQNTVLKLSWAEWINISSRNQIAWKIKTVIDEETSDETFCNNGDAVDMDRDMNFLMNDFLFYGQIKGKSPTCSTKWRGSSDETLVNNEDAVEESLNETNRPVLSP